jgi:hypothetical protein
LYNIKYILLKKKKYCQKNIIMNKQKNINIKKIDDIFNLTIMPENPTKLINKSEQLTKTKKQTNIKKNKNNTNIKKTKKNKTKK